MFVIELMALNFFFLIFKYSKINFTPGPPLVSPHTRWTTQKGGSPGGCRLSGRHLTLPAKNAGPRMLKQVGPPGTVDVPTVRDSVWRCVTACSLGSEFAFLFKVFLRLSSADNRENPPGGLVNRKCSCSTIQAAESEFRGSGPWSCPVTAVHAEVGDPQCAAAAAPWGWVFTCWTVAPDSDAEWETGCRRCCLTWGSECVHTGHHRSMHRSSEMRGF